MSSIIFGSDSMFGSEGISILLCQHGWYTKFSCFSRNGTSEQRMKFRRKTNGPYGVLWILNAKMFFKRVWCNKPLLHIKLGLMKPCVKALPKEDECIKYFWYKYPYYPMISLKKVCDGRLVLLVPSRGSSQA